MDDISISVFRRSGEKYYHMQYRDPVSGQKVRKSTGVMKKREADRIAAKWEKEIRAGNDWRRGQMEWSQFREIYETQKLSGLAEKTEQKSITVLNVLDRIIKPRKLKDLNTQTLNRYQSELRKLGRKEQTIKSHLAHIRSALSWAYDQSWIDAVPRMPKIQRAKTSKVMKGRAITTEEFERMLEAVGKVIVEPNKGKAQKRSDRKPDLRRVPSWQDLIRGLWLSGLRLGEAMELHWSDVTKIRVDMSGRHPMFRIPEESEKGNEDRVLPLSPEFAEWLYTVPKKNRRGHVFNPIPQNYGKDRLGSQTVGRTIASIGQAAGIIVDWKPAANAGDEPTPLFASAHDLRRSFGERWSSRLMPKELMELMRHKSIDTTMRFYVGQNADKTASILWAAHRESMRAVGADLGADRLSDNLDPSETPKK
jgi:integrase